MINWWLTDKKEFKERFINLSREGRKTLKLGKRRYQRIKVAFKGSDKGRTRYEKN